MCLGHMLRDHDRITELLFFSWMQSDSASVEEHLDDSPCKADVDIPADQIIGDGILVFSVRNEIIKGNLCSGPDCRFIRSQRKLLHEIAFFFDVCAVTVSFPFFKRDVVELLELLTDRLLHFTEGEELTVPKRCDDPRRNELNSSFCKALVLRVFHPGRNDGCIVVFSDFVITFVDERFIPGVACHPGLEIVRDQEPGDSAEV